MNGPLDGRLPGRPAGDGEDDRTRRGEEMFGIIFAHAPIGIALVSPEGIFLRANPTFCKALGYTEEEMTRLSVRDVTEPADLPSSLEAIRRMQSGESNTFHLEKRYRRKDGQIMWARTSVAMVRDGQDRPQNMIAQIQDITERQGAEEALRESEARYRQLFEQMMEGVVLYEILCTPQGTPCDGRILDINPAFERLTGMPRDAVIGKRMLEIWPHTPPLLVERFGLAALTGLPDHFTQHYEDRDREFEINVFRPQAGCCAVIFRDVTERIRYEQEQSRAQRLESLGVLAGGIAHDFNNMLTAILGNLQVAQQAAAAEDKRTLLDEAEKACLRAQHLTQQLLTFARGGAPVKKVLAPESLLRETATFALRGSAMQCSFHLPPDLWPVEADPGQLAQVVQNLVLNAEQAMPDGGSIVITGENKELQDPEGLPLQPGKYVVISITDTGVGIAEKHLEHIFDPYFTTKQKGSGLGLATSLSIARRHHGHITVRSRTGEGSTFSLWLPAAATDAAPPVPPPASTAAAAAARVLLLDDEQPIRALARRMLEYYGYRVATVAHGQEAVRVAEEALRAGDPFDFAILDLTIPGGMGGKDALRELRKSHPRLKAVVMSGYSTDPVMAQFRDYGFDGILAKPFGLRELRAALAQASSA